MSWWLFEHWPDQLKFFGLILLILCAFLLGSCTATLTRAKSGSPWVLVPLVFVIVLTLLLTVRRGNSSKTPKTVIVLAVAALAVGGIYGFVYPHRQAGEPSASELLSSCAKTCIPIVGESESGQKYCDCMCNGLQQRYPGDELEALYKRINTAQDPISAAQSETGDLGTQCVALWRGPEYPTSVRQQFLQTCHQGDEAYCECVLGWFEQRYSLSEYMQFLAQIQKDSTFQLPGATDARTACRIQNGG